MNSEKFSNDNIFLRILDFFYILRPTLFFPGITIYLFGIKDSDSSFIVIPFIITLLLLSTTYLTNQIFDIKTDRINDKLFFLTRNIISINMVKLYNTLIIILFFSFSIYYFDLSSAIFLTLIYFLFVIIVILYNFKKFNWKAKPLLSIISSFLGGLIFYLVGYYSNILDINTVSFNSFFISILNAIPFGIAVLSVSIMTMISDEVGDKVADKNTFVVHYKIRVSNNTIILFSFLNSLISYYVLNEVVLIISVISLILSIVFQIKNYEVKYLLLNIKISILLLSIAIGFVFPLYIAIIVTYFIITRMYYKKRFNIIYP